MSPVVNIRRRFLGGSLPWGRSAACNGRDGKPASQPASKHIPDSAHGGDWCQFPEPSFLSLPDKKASTLAGNKGPDFVTRPGMSDVLCSWRPSILALQSHDWPVCPNNLRGAGRHPKQLVLKMILSLMQWVAAKSGHVRQGSSPIIKLSVRAVLV